MWFILQVLAAGALTLVALAVGWWVVWKLILSKFSFFQEIFGLRSQKSIEIAALKKKKQQMNNTFILTRSGEQMARNRETIKAQQAAALLRSQLPTTTPLSGSSLYQSDLSSSSYSPSPASLADSTIMLDGNLNASQLHARRSSHKSQSGASSGVPLASSQQFNTNSHHIPTSSSGTAAIAAEALHRRYANQPPSSGSSSSSTPLPHSQSSTSVAGMDAKKDSKPSSAANTQTIGGTGWLQRAAIIEDYQPQQRGK